MEEVEIVLGRDGRGYLRYKVQSVQGRGIVEAKEQLMQDTTIRIQADALEIKFDQNLGWIIKPIRHKEKIPSKKLTPQQRKIINILKEAGRPLTQKEIANRMNVKPQAIWSSLQELVKEGILIRSEERPFKYSIAYELQSNRA